MASCERLSVKGSFHTGADSVALLGLLWRLARKRGWRLVVGHVDHGLRPESVREAQQVRELCAAFELPCEITRITVAPGPDLAARIAA